MCGTLARGLQSSIVIMKIALALRLVLSITTLACAASTAGCMTADDLAEEETESSADELSSSSLRDGVNSNGCKRSPYNCSLRPGGAGQRVTNAAGGQNWAIDEGWLAARGYVDPVTKLAVVPVVDGNGDEMGRVRKLTFVLNFGQTRRMKDLTWVYALSAGLKSGGWVPLDAFGARDSLRAHVGEVNARGDNLAKMECYEVKATYPARLDNYKVVKNTTDKDSMEPNDYLPGVRANGKVYVNLAFSVPGDGLGAPAVDIFPAGTKFQRVDVPTWENPDRPSIDATLYAKPKGSTKYTQPSGEMKFVYGYVKSDLGSVRYGWLAYDGITPSKGCPNR